MNHKNVVIFSTRYLEIDKYLFGKGHKSCIQSNVLCRYFLNEQLPPHIKEYLFLSQHEHADLEEIIRQEIQENSAIKIDANNVAFITLLLSSYANSILQNKLYKKIK